MILPDTAAQWHAAFNDFPSILLLLSLGFDLSGAITKRESLKAAGFWTIVVAAGGALAALTTGLIAEDTIEHGGSVHLVMERHETMAITVTVLIVGLAGWRIWRRGTLGPRERPTYLTVAGIGALAVLWTASLGGSIVYEYGGGVPTPVLEGALQERNAGHTHGPGEEHDRAGEADSLAVSDDTTWAATEDHTHAPGTPEHEHD